MRRCAKIAGIAIAGWFVVSIVLMALIAIIGAFVGDTESPSEDPAAPTGVEEPTATPNPPTATPTAGPTATPSPPTATPTPTGPVCSEPEGESLSDLLTEFVSCKSDISKDTRDLVALLIELEGFRDDPEFHEVGFGVCCRFNDWLKDAESLRDRASLSPLSELGVVPEEVIQIGLYYVQSGGQPTDYTEFVVSELKVTVIESMGLGQAGLTPTDAECSPPGAVLGKWSYALTSTISERITIVCDEMGQWQLISLFSDGSGSTSALIESQSPRGRRFDEIGNDFGEYFVVDANGNLHIWDRTGFIATARKAG